MDALILSCSTGGGHNAAGIAIRDELTARGHRAEFLDPYSLVSDKLSANVGKVYVRIAQKAPRIFGSLYAAGTLVRHIPVKSPIYWANVRVAERLAAYLKKNHFDVIIMPHLFPAEMLTYLRRRHRALPLTVFVATDYTCIPFTEETECDFYIVPGKAQMAEFVKRGISRDRLLPYGIPVAGALYEELPKEKAREMLELDIDKKYILVTGGSIGAGALEKAAEVLVQYRKEQEIDTEIILVCGNNESLYRRLSSRYQGELRLIRRTSRLALYMKACDVFISKPGGLSSTEAAVAGIPFIQITPIPGCETHNMRLFTKKGMALGVKNPKKGLTPALDRLCRPEEIERMREAQEKGLPARALFEICDWLEEKTGAAMQAAPQTVPAPENNPQRSCRSTEDC